jgi:hypothetical protein
MPNQEENPQQKCRSVLSSLWKDKNIVILPVNKGNVTVVMLDQDYWNEMWWILNDPVYRKSTTDPTSKIERKTTLIIKKSEIVEDTVKKLSPHCTAMPRVYGVLKIHKADVPLRLMVNYISWATFGPAAHWLRHLRPLVGNSIHHIKNSGAFVQKLMNIKLQGFFGELWCDIIVHQSTTALHMLLQHVAGVSDLLRPVLTTTYFLCDGTFYKPISFVATESPVAPIKPTHLYRYVNDTFVV